MKLIKLAFIAVLFGANVAAAAVTEYTDRASFEAANGPLTLLTFEGIGDQVNLGTSVDFGVLNVTNAGSVYSTDVGGGFGAPSGQIGDQNNENTLITLPPGYNALGMDIGLLFNAGVVNITLRDEFDNIVASGNRSVADNNDLGLADSTFYGWVSTTGEIRSLQLDAGGFPTIDNVLFNGEASVIIPTEPVPTSSQWSLMLLIILFLGVGGMVLRNKKARFEYK
jgi:hypothetical protein